jgi:hypothetical protein
MKTSAVLRMKRKKGKQKDKTKRKSILHKSNTILKYRF